MSDSHIISIRESIIMEDVLTALDGKLFVTVPEAATYLRSDPRSVRRAIAAGEIPSTRVGPRQLIPAAWLRRAAALDTDEAGQ